MKFSPDPLDADDFDERPAPPPRPQRRPRVVTRG
jgi:hypothetical protein